ncbi:MAG: CoA-binding protein [Symploca sp. SIO2B6]|nr:CoA-binding protein [Symploca sp. SIO2B6]
MNLTPESKVLVQGITQPLALHHTARMKAYGTKIIAGISTGQGGQQLQDIPVFDLVEEACNYAGVIDITIIFMKPYQAMDAALEAIDAGIRQIILVTGGIPPLDMVRLLHKAQATKTIIVGPSSSGIILPGKVLVGTQETKFYTPGSVGLITRAGILTYEVSLALTQAKLGQSIAIDLGGESIISSSFQHWLRVLAKDQNTKAIVIVDQIGGTTKTEITEYIADCVSKPVVAYLVGQHTPREQQGINAATIITTQLAGSTAKATTCQDELKAFKRAKVPVAERPSQIPSLVKKALKKN